jgi:hypothetical protein
MGASAMARRRIPLAILCTVALAGAVVSGTGCERRSAQPGPAPGAPAARVVVTADHGADVLRDARVAPGRSVLVSLKGVTPVQTAYGGGFVQGMLGRASRTSPPADWFFFLNGMESPVGAAAVDLAPGDVTWWDHRAWGGMQSIRGVVGSWPQPFINGAGGARPVVAADAPLAGPLRAAGARIGTGDRAFRVRVGTDATLARRDPAWRAIGGDPAARAVAGGITNGAVVLMPPGGGTPVPVAGARAIAVLVPVGPAPRDGALLAVAGLDHGAARAAARAIADDPAVLALRYAVAFDGDGQAVRAAGRGTP